MIGVILTYTFVRSVRIYIKTIYSIKWIRKEQSCFQNAPQIIEANIVPDIILLLPVLREERELPDLLKQMLSLKYPQGKLHIVVITTEKERGDPRTFSKKYTTIELANETIEQYNGCMKDKFFYHIHFPYREGNKASQLNFAIQELPKMFPTISEPKTYIGVYDADSRPDPHTTTYIGWNATLSQAEGFEFPPAYQQVSIYFKNFTKLPDTMEGILLKLEAIFQTRWSLGYELPNYFEQYINYTNPSKSKLQFLIDSRLNYFIGHGCFIRLDILHKVGGFPTYSATEDLSLGYILSLLKIPIKPIPFFDFCEVPISLKILVNQSKAWFATEMSIFLTVQFVKRNYSNVDWIRVIYLTFQRTIMNVSWALGGVLVLLSILISFLLPYYAKEFFIFGVISGLSYTTFGIAYMIFFLKSFDSYRNNEYIQDFYKSMDWKAITLSLIYSPLKSIINCIGPLLFFYSLLIAKVKHIKPVYLKTERDSFGRNNESKNIGINSDSSQK